MGWSSVLTCESAHNAIRRLRRGSPRPLCVKEDATLGNNYWQAINGLVSELKSCDNHGIVTASIAMSFVCIDTLANLGRPIDKSRVTRKDFKDWVNAHLSGHPDQPYQYRGKDVYAARCAMLHTYGSEASLHEEDPDTIMFAYHDGGKHNYDPSIKRDLVLIGVSSFVNDVVCAVQSFLDECQKDPLLRQRVEERLPKVLQVKPFSTE
jgi:hypothetical protein